MVINYDFPTGVEDYVHRIGRTGRAGASGVAYTFFGDQDAKYASDLIKVLEGANQRVPPEIRDMASRGGGMNRFRRWGSGPGGRDGGRSGRSDSSYGGRGFSSSGGGHGYDSGSRDRYMRFLTIVHEICALICASQVLDAFTCCLGHYITKSDGFSAFCLWDRFDRGYQNGYDRGRSRSRSPLGWSSRNRERSRSRSLDRASRPASSFHQAMMEKARPSSPPQKQRGSNNDRVSPPHGGGSEKENFVRDGIDNGGYGGGPYSSRYSEEVEEGMIPQDE